MHEEYAHIGELHFKVMEEVGELLQAYGKVGRFGAMSKHPDRPEGLTNAEQVIMECEDVVTRVRELKAEMYDVMRVETNKALTEAIETGDMTEDDAAQILSESINSEVESCVVDNMKDMNDIKLVSALVDELDENIQTPGVSIREVD